MAFPTIDVSSPRGTDKVSTIDDRERETRTWLRDSLIEIAGYPDCPYIKLGRWTTAGRPASPATGVFGYNTTLSRLEYWNGSAWAQMNVDNTSTTVANATHADNADVATKAIKDGDGNTISSTYMKVGGSTISGNITIQNASPTYSAKTTGLTIGTSPSANTSKYPVQFLDNNGARLLSLYKYVGTNKESSTRLYDYNHVNGGGDYIGINHNSSGGVFTYAPTPQTSDNSTQIATTAFVKSVIAGMNDYVVAKSIAANGYIQFNSGLVIMWGTVAQANRGSSYSRTITYPKAVSTVYFGGNSQIPIQADAYYNSAGYLSDQTYNASNVVQTVNSRHDSEGNIIYPTYFPAFKFIVIGKV